MCWECSMCCEWSIKHTPDPAQGAVSNLRQKRKQEAFACSLCDFLVSLHSWQPLPSVFSTPVLCTTQGRCTPTNRQGAHLCDHGVADNSLIRTDKTKASRHRSHPWASEPCQTLVPTPEARGEGGQLWHKHRFPLAWLSWLCVLLNKFRFGKDYFWYTAT